MAEVEYGGIKVGGSKLLLIVPLIGTILGGAWGGFEVYQRYLSMEAKIDSYIAPDLSGIEKDLAVISEHMNTVNSHMAFVSKEIDLFKEELDLIKENVDEQIKYVKEVKMDVREDMRHLESVVNDVETKLQNQKKDLAEMIDIADKRFDDRRDSLYTDTDRKIKELEERLNSRLQRALDNPLAN
jgi:septal ring factor EnvC (AmiA/AmiB activator)